MFIIGELVAKPVSENGFKKLYSGPLFPPKLVPQFLPAKNAPDFSCQPRFVIWEKNRLPAGVIFRFYNQE